ncbi:MAG: hypothetical protein ABWY12_00470, partial [Burkholderiales bacterium]
MQVAYKFIDASFQTDWVYRSLDATLVLPNRKRAPDHVAVEGDSLMATFCLASSELAALGSAWTFAVATRRFTIVPRPTTKMDSRFDEINKKQISLFSMPLIRLADERRPDWVILRSARWQRTADGALRLDIELVNPTEQVFAGSELTLSFEREKTISCRAGPTYQEPKPVPVEIKVQSGTVTVASGDPQYGELVRRPATVKVEGCFEPARVAMSLGPSTSELAGQAAR